MARRVKKRRLEVQLHLDRLRHGGKRDGAGRPRRSPFVNHVARPRLAKHEPVHITIRVKSGLPSLRSKKMYQAIRGALGKTNAELGLEVRQHSAQPDHIHLIAEVQSRTALARGMQGLMIRLAKAINRAANRKGKVFRDRYHVEVLRTPRQVRNALAYVLNNLRHHLAQRDIDQHAGDEVDELSSAPWFDGWRGRVKHGATGPPPHAVARTWLLTKGWRRHGLLDPAYVPTIR